MSIKAQDELLNSPMFDTILLHSPLQPIHHEMESVSDINLDGNSESEVLVPALPNRCAVNIFQLEPPTKAVQLWSLQFAYRFEVPELHCNHGDVQFVPIVGFVLGFKWTARLNHFIDLQEARLKA